MRLKTIKKRMCLTSLPFEAIELLYIMMHNINDESTETGQKNNGLWAAAVVFIFTKFTALGQRELIFITDLTTQNNKGGE